MRFICLQNIETSASYHKCSRANDKSHTRWNIPNVEVHFAALIYRVEVRKYELLILDRLFAHLSRRLIDRWISQSPAFDMFTLDYTCVGLRSHKLARGG